MDETDQKQGGPVYTGYCYCGCGARLEYPNVWKYSECMKRWWERVALAKVSVQ